MQRNVLDLEVERAAAIEPEANEILDELRLSVDDDRPPAGELAQGYPVALAGELQRDAVVDETLADETLPGACLDKEVDDPLLDDPGTDPRLDVLPASILEEHRLDALATQQVREQEPGRPRADDGHLRAGSIQAVPSSSSTRWAIANAPFAAGTPQ